MTEGGLSSASRPDRPVRLLVIDDNPHDRELLARALRQRFSAVNIEPVRDAQELARALRYSTFDAAIVDYELGWSNGLEVFRQIRQSRTQCPVLMFTASGSEEVAVQAMKEGLTDYITKTAKHYARLPFALERALDRVTQGRALQFAESARIQLTGELRVGRLRLQLALQAAGMVAWQRELATDRMELSVNAVDVVGTQWTSYAEVLAAIYDDDLPTFRNACERCREGGEPFICAVRIRDSRTQGARWLEFRGQPFHDVTGKLTHVLGVALDITERKRAEEEAQAADRRKDAFLATLAHELRNPLAPIRYATRLLAPGVPAQVAADARKMLDRQLTHMARLLDDLMDMSRVTHGLLHIRQDLIDLREVIDTAVKAARAVAADTHRNLVVRVPASPLPVRGDLDRLTQVIGNLLSNAMRYTNADGHIELEAHLDEAESLVIVKVRDDGIGIVPEMLSTIFAPFVQGDPKDQRAAEGLGIGLSLARDLIALHGGHLEARSAGKGHGSEFIVRLPRSIETPAHGTSDVPQNIAVLGASTLRVLVVDDNTDAANALASVLNLAGLKTEVAYDGNAALEIAARVGPNLALLDIGLPTMSGYELARQLRSLPGGTSMYLVAVTGWGQEADRRKSLAAGFDEHLTKPVDPQQLIGLLAQHVRLTG